MKLNLVNFFTDNFERGRTSTNITFPSALDISKLLIITRNSHGSNLVSCGTPATCRSEYKSFANQLFAVYS